MLSLLGVVGGIFGLYCFFTGYGEIKRFGLGLTGVASVFLGISSKKPGEITAGIIMLMIAIMLQVITSSNAKKPNVQAALREELKKEYSEAVASQEASEPWAVRYSTEPCPICGHYKVRCAKWEDKRLSVAFWGIGSAAIGKDFKCEHCDQMW